MGFVALLLLRLDMERRGFGRLYGTFYRHVKVLISSGGGGGGVAFHVVFLSILGCGSRRTGVYSMPIGLLSSDLVCGEEATAWTAGSTHGMFVTRLVKVWLERVHYYIYAD